MRRILAAIASLYRRWKYAEDTRPDEQRIGRPSGEDEFLRLRQAMEREERMLADYRRNGCASLAGGHESTLRALRTRLAAIEPGPHRTR